MERHTLVQILGLGSFATLAAVAFVLTGSFSGGYTIGLLLGFGVGVAVAVFQYGVVVETETRSRGYPTEVARKIDRVFE